METRGKRPCISMEERNVLKPVNVVIDSRGEVGEGVDGEVDEDETSLEPRRSFSASSQVAYGSLREEGRRNEQSECEQRSTEGEYYSLCINRMIECCSDTKAE